MATLFFTRESWQYAFLVYKNEIRKKPIYLTKGKHTVAFTSHSSVIPLVETILLSRDEKTIISSEKYDIFSAELSTHKLPNNYVDFKTKKGARQLDNPKGNYQHEFDVNFTYTYVATFNFAAGQSFTFETRNSNCDPVMHLFYLNNPAQAGWLNDDTVNGNLESTINGTISQSGVYVLLIRAYSYPGGPTYSGLTNVWRDGSLWASSCVVAGGSLVDNGFPPASQLDFFTADLRPSSSDPRLFLFFGSNNNSSYQSKVIAYNDDYSGPGGFDWGYASRINSIDLPNFDRNYSFVCANSASNPTGTCDLYANCLPLSASQKSLYPNLYPGDAIMSGPGSPRTSIGYNCYAWAGGVTDRVLSYPEEFDYWSDPNSQVAFDNWFGNTPVPRYAGAWTYTRVGANADNAVIDLYKVGQTITHASVRKPGNDHPHGYSWESKNGYEDRFMHPRDAIQGNDLGYISEHYQDTGIRGRKTGNATHNMSYEQSLREGYSIVVETGLIEKDSLFLKQLVAAISPLEKNQFDALYQAWRDECEKQKTIIQRDEYLRTKNESYRRLSDWLKTKGKRVYVLLFDRFFTGDDIDLWSRFLVSDITFPEYQSYWTEMKQADTDPKNWYNNKGAYLIRHPDDNCRRYLLKILPLFATDVIPLEKSIFYPNFLNTSTTYNLDVTLIKPSTVRITLLDLDGTPDQNLGTDQMYREGRHSLLLNLGSVQTGTYLLKVSNQNREETIRVIVNH